MQPNCEKTISILTKLNQHYNKSKLEAFKLLYNFANTILVQFQEETFSILSPEQISIKNENTIEIHYNKRKNKINDIFIAPEIKLGIHSAPETSLLYSIGIIFEYIAITQENWDTISNSPYQATELIESDGIKDITQKLVSRDSDYRYQTLSGLIYDVETLLKNYEVTGRTDSFVLGKEDKHHRLNLKKYIFGRDKEISAINSAILANETATVIISGKSGIGKTYLINKVINQYEKQYAIINVKFDQENTTTDDGIEQILTHLSNFIRDSKSNDLMNSWSSIYSDFKSDLEHSKSNHVHLIETLINIAQY